MDIPTPPQHNAQIEAFGRRHRADLVTLVFTDLVGSTALKQQLGDHAAAQLLEQHHALVRATLAEFPEGQELSTAGDSFLLVFATPSAGVKFALVLQQRLRELSRQAAVPVQDRMGLHLGEVLIQEADQQRTKDLIGLNVDLGARVMGLAQGGQILLTRAVFDSARQALKGEDIAGVGQLSWLNHGLYQLKGIEDAVEICEVGEVGTGPLRSPATTEKARRVEAAQGEAVLGWRPAAGQSVPNTKWVLEQKLGEGGFGEVWLGRHQAMKERRVFKFCFRADRVRSLKREMTLFRLIKERIGDHPNIVRLLGVYFDHAPYYVEMDYVEGQDLRTWCEAQGGAEKVPLAVKLEIVAQIADALQAAHDAGVIHRDVKPGNILVSGRWSVVSGQKEAGHSSLVTEHSSLSAKLTDFGIGQVVSEEYLAGITRTGLTQTILADSSSSKTGTQLYMAPELLAGKPASTRSDIYSLGVVLYQLLVGDFTRPLATDWADQIADALLREDLKRCFAGDPQARFAGAGQLAQNLRSLPERRTELDRRAFEKAALQRAAYRRGVIRTASLAAGIVAIMAALALLALKQSQRAQAEAAKATQAAAAEKRERTATQRHLYVAKMNLAQHAWEQSDVGQVRRLLEETATYPERGFEWYYWQRQTHLPIKTLRGHVGSVLAVAVSPDSQRVVTGSEDETARVWEADSGKELFVLKGHGAAIRSVAFSPDGQRIVTGSWDQTAKVWDAAKGRELTTLRGHTAPIRSVAFSPDGQWIVTGSEDQTARVWEAATGRELLILKGHGAPVWSVAFSPDGRRIVTGGWDQMAKVWEASTGKELVTLKGHTAVIRSVAFSPDGRRILTGSEDQTARVWDSAGGKELLTLKGHSAAVSSAAFSPDGQRIVTGSGDQTARVWEATSGNELLILRGHSSSVDSVAYSTDGRRIVTGSGDQTAMVWEDASGKERLTPGGRSVYIDCAASSPDGRRTITGSVDPTGTGTVTSRDQTATVWDAASGRELLKLRGHSAWVSAVAFSPDGQRILTGSWDQTARVWEAATGKELLTLRGHRGAMESVASSLDGRRIVTGCFEDQTAKLWDAVTGKELLTLKGHTGRVTAANISSDGQWIVTGSKDQTAKEWEAASGKELLTLRGHSAAITSVAFSADGQRILTGSSDQTVKVWDASSGRELLTLKGHSGPVLSAVLSLDGHRIVTASSDLTAKVWEITNGEELLTLKGHSAAVISAAFSLDGQQIVTVSSDQMAKVWRAASETQLANWRQEEQAAAESLAKQQQERAAAERNRARPAEDPGEIKHWLVLLPIPFQGPDGGPALQDEQVEREGQLRPRVGERTKAGQVELVWRAVKLEDYRIDFNLLAGTLTHYSVAYAVCYLASETDQSNVLLKIGSDDQAKVYLNDKLIYQRRFWRAYVADQDVVASGELKAGINVLVFKVVNETGEWKGSIRLTDTSGQPLKGIRVTLDPEAKSSP